MCYSSSIEVNTLHIISGLSEIIPRREYQELMLTLKQRKKQRKTLQHLAIIKAEKHFPVKALFGENTSRRHLSAVDRCYGRHAYHGQCRADLQILS